MKIWIIAAFANATLAIAQPLLTCAPSTPLAIASDEVTLTAWASAKNGHIAWTTGAGAVRDGAAFQTTWKLNDVPVGTQTATADLTVDGKVVAKCSVSIQIVASTTHRDPGRTPALTFLNFGQDETSGLGLYSYLVFGSMPRDNDKERYRAAIEACQRFMPAMLELRTYLPLKSLNSTFIPVKRPPQFGADAAWILDNYDYSRAKALLTKVPGASPSGMYLVSASQPLLNSKGKNPLLVQDLSSVPAPLVSTWVSAFINQAAQEHYWEKKTSGDLVLKLRLSIAILAEGYPEVKSAVSQWINVKN